MSAGFQTPQYSHCPHLPLPPTAVQFSRIQPVEDQELSPWNSLISDFHQAELTPSAPRWSRERKLSQGRLQGEEGRAWECEEGPRRASDQEVGIIWLRQKSRELSILLP